MSTKFRTYDLAVEFYRAASCLKLPASHLICLRELREARQKISGDSMISLLRAQRNQKQSSI